MTRQVFKSPLEMVVQDKKLTMILEQMRETIRRAGEFLIPKEDVCHVREAFRTAVEAGENSLYRFAQEMTDRMLGSPLSLFLEVWGRCPEKEHREIQKARTALGGSFHDLIGEGDSSRAALHAPFCWCGAKSVSITSFVKAVPKNENHYGIRLISTRIKTPSNIAYKVADILFDMDTMFRRDKIRNRYSQVVKDAYGIKVITRDLDSLQVTMRWLGDVFGDDILEMKDYLGPRKKKSGFEALKLVVQQNLQVYEVQLQTEEMLEREILGFRQNHQTYKERQMRLRARLGRRYEEAHKALEVLFCAGGTKCQGLNIKEAERQPGMNHQFASTDCL